MPIGSRRNSTLPPLKVQVGVDNVDLNRGQHWLIKVKYGIKVNYGRNHLQTFVVKEEQVYYNCKIVYLFKEADSRNHLQTFVVREELV